MTLQRTIAVAAAALWSSALLADPAPARITNLYDAFGAASRPDATTLDWGFAALVELDGRRILFDTGNNAQIFARNASALGLDLSKIDLVVLSHRHGDHTSGLSAVLRVAPDVDVYVPAENFGAFGGTLPGTIYRPDDRLPPQMRYFDGRVPESFDSGTPWTGAHFHHVDSAIEILPGLRLIPTISRTVGTLELRELSLSIATPQGQVLIVGCSHPGIEHIVDAASGIGGHVHLVLGGFHMPATPDPEIERIAKSLRDDRGVDLVAPAHCSGERAFGIFRELFGDRYLYAGLGEVIPILAH